LTISDLNNILKQFIFCVSRQIVANKNG
jgi:hypothetical protein